MLPVATITEEIFNHLVAQLGEQAIEDILWSESLSLPQDEEDFALNFIFVVVNSGMHNQVAQKIFDRCLDAVRRGDPVTSVFKHPGKARAIDEVWNNRHTHYQAFLVAPDRLAYVANLPWIGKITKYHLAKNLGIADVAKPDVHLQRLADREGCSVQAMCERLALQVGYRVGTVDTILWRACANGVLDSKTGSIASSQP